ncbi:MAG: hypothetical protein FWH41_06840, partial [Treponema sp.]|nr:hypothetical protein [Treponema sp.]
MKKKYPLLFLIFLCSFFLCNCDLFTKPKDPHYLKKIDEEIAWANAPKISVSVQYNTEWGQSPQLSGCVDEKRGTAPRKGYPFKVEFNSGMAFGEPEWRAYYSKELEEDAVKDWANNPTVPLLLALEPVSAEYVFFNPPRGRASTVTVSTTKGITIVPYCISEPRIMEIYPPLTESEPYLAISKSQEIIISFAAGIKETSARFGEGSVAVTGRPETSVPGSETDYSPYFGLSYDAWRKTVTLTPGAGTAGAYPPVGSIITIELGEGIKSLVGENPLPEPKKYAYQTVSVNPIFEWYADYDIDGNTITVSWENPPGVTPKAWYFINGARANDPALNEAKNKFTISGVPRLNASNVRNGRPVENIYEYQIYLESTSADGSEITGPIKIWNFGTMGSGMSVSWKKQITEIKTAQDLADIQLDDANAQYVLANDIAISNTDFSGGWIPLGVEEKPFRGKFYGNGHSITFNGSFAPAAYTGIFGYAQGAEIRDLTVAYGDTVVNATQSVARDTFKLGMDENDIINLYYLNNCNAFYAGGLAGYLVDTGICNVITTGTALRVTPSGSITTWLGGITGYIEGSGKIENSYAALSVACNSGGSGNAVIGAVAGEAGPGSTENKISINNGYKNPNDLGPDNIILYKLIIDRVTADGNVCGNMGNDEGWLSIGGAVGISRENTMYDLLYIRGTVSISRDAFFDFIGYEAIVLDVFGGLIGIAADTNLENCSFNGFIEPVINGNVSNVTAFGGLVGYYTSAGTAVYFNNCRVKGNIDFEFGCMSFFGGVVGITSVESNSSGNITMTNSFFEEGNITIRNFSDYFFFVGGYAGYIQSSWTNIENNIIINNNIYLYNCGSLAGLITVESESYSLSAGGFTSENIGTLSNCFSRTDIIAICKNYEFYIGGFVGRNAGDINNCYATGSIRSALNFTPLHTPNTSYVGGFAGSLYIGKIENCYSLGNVMANNTSGGGQYLGVGGLAGYQNHDTEITKCFSAGQISAFSSYNDSVYAGGISGYSSDREMKLNNTASLGSRVTASGNGFYVFARR